MIARISAVLWLTVACVALAAGPARADDVYSVHTCRGPSGQPAAADGWVHRGVGVQHRSDCLSGGEITSGPPRVQLGLYGNFTWSFVAPSDTRIVAWTLWRTVELTGGNGWGFNWHLTRDEMIADPAHLVELCYFTGHGCRGRGNGRVDEASRVGESGVDLGAILGRIDCNPAPCPAGASASMRIHRGDFTLRDTADPAFSGVPSGDLLETTRPVAGMAGVSYSATDRGGGVYRATVEVDGEVVASEVADDNGGRCRKPFTAAVPCRRTVSGTISVDTTALPDGEHTVRVIISDPTETNTAVHGPVKIRTQNRSPECDPAVRAAATPVTAGFGSKARRTQARRRSGRATVTGRIAGAGAGTLVHLLSRERRAGAPAELAGTATTEADGSFSLRVPAGPSRRLRAAYRARPGDPLLACSRPLNVRVPARLSFRASPSRVRPGGRVRLSGRLLGGRVPRQGKLVDFQARSGGVWRTFDTGRSDSKGRFRGGYRFHPRAIAATYPMRVRVRADGSYPFDLGYSRAVNVRVR